MIFLDRLRALFRASPVFLLSPTGHGDPPPHEQGLDIDAAGWLTGPLVHRVPSVRHSRLTTPGQEPAAIVAHYTAVKPGVPLWNRIRTYDPARDRAASWHVLIEDDGSVYQSVPFVRGSWHCARGRIDGHRVNACSVGIELAGHGKAFTDQQVSAFETLLTALVVAYDIRRENACYAHSMFDPTRRSDPGALWMDTIAPAIIDRVYGGRH